MNNMKKIQFPSKFIVIRKNGASPFWGIAADAKRLERKGGGRKMRPSAGGRVETAPLS